MNPEAPPFEPPGAKDQPALPDMLVRFKNSFTPRDRRSSNGPGASPADKYPEDSPTRTRPPPRFSAMQRRFPEQQKLDVEDVQAFPSLGEAAKQSRHRRMTVRTSSAGPAMPDRSASPPGFEEQQEILSQERVSAVAETSSLTAEERVVMQAHASALCQRLLEQLTPTRASPGQQQGPGEQLSAVQERPSLQQQPTLHTAFQQRRAQQPMDMQHQRQLAEKQIREAEQEMAQRPRPQFVQESVADLVALQEQGRLTAHERQHVSPAPATGPGRNLTYDFGRLAASQQAQRQATLAQLHSVFMEPQPGAQGQAAERVVPTGLPGLGLPSQGHDTERASHATIPGLGHSERIFPATIPGLDHTERSISSAAFTGPGLLLRPQVQHDPGVLPPPHQGLRYHWPTERDPLTTSLNRAFLQGLPTQRDPLTGQALRPQAGASAYHNMGPYAPPPAGVNPDLQAYLAHAGIPSADPALSSHGDYDNPSVYAPVFPSTTDEDPTPWTKADYDTTPPLSPTLWNASTRDALTPDPRPLTEDQKTGLKYGVEVGALGVSRLGTSDRFTWLEGAWPQKSVPAPKPRVMGGADIFVGHPDDQPGAKKQERGDGRKKGTWTRDIPLKRPGGV
ncbi:hypothetical protein BU23DRAFT_159073 [Bimuria novae-zelandiae CBS 107.79]|uniref:Uncharacterized protein n=1 Tax=Bimuria novae-zelandiae CBS 107.79 TaxID=1447943 RepID=A0A6A5VGP0_9PLEO|nr:hypothetical protein BU23DRAFT_159073 [Bimuria novae-zelandiae CBS 107.79]